MNIFANTGLSMFGIQKAKMQTTDPSHHRQNSDHHRYSTYQKQDFHMHSDESATRKRYIAIPAIPSDIAYNSGSKSTGGSHSTGFISNAGGNPAVIIGMGLTTMALLGMIKKSIVGDKLGTQKYMRYRILAQFFTVTALVAGVTVFAKNPNVTKEDKPTILIAKSAL